MAWGWLFLTLIALMGLWAYQQGWTSTTLRDITCHKVYFWGTLLFGAAIVWGTELLSAFHLLRQGVARGVLVLAVVVLLGVLLRKERRFPECQRPTAKTLALLSYPVLAGGLTFVQAWLSPPNTIDAFTYHLGRVIHWVQNASLAPYPTHILRQIYQAPGAEEILLWLRLATGNDQLANFVQWGAWISILVVLYALARRLTPQVSPWWAVWGGATLPTGIVEAASTQNDLVLAYWILLAVFFLLAYEADGQRRDAVAASLAFGLSINTKSTAYLWMGVFGLGFLFLLLKRKDFKTAIMGGLLGLSLIAGHGVRTTEVFGSPVGSPSLRQAYLNEAYSPKVWLSNAARHTAVHFGFPQAHVYTFFLDYQRTEQAVRRFHDIIGVDVSWAKTTWGEDEFYVISQRTPTEDTTGSPYHLVLMVVASMWALRKGQPTLRKYVVAVWLAWAIFVLMLKWQPWIMRLQLPWFLLLVPVIGWMLGYSRRFSRQIISFAIIAGLVLQAWPALTRNMLRPLAGHKTLFNHSRTYWFFRGHLSARQHYLAAFSLLNDAQCNQIGLIIREGDWEYPWWYFLEPKQPGVRLEHLHVTNETRFFADNIPPFEPCALVVSNTKDPPSAIEEPGVGVFQSVFVGEDAPFALYLLDSP